MYILEQVLEETTIAEDDIAEHFAVPSVLYPEQYFF